MIYRRGSTPGRAAAPSTRNAEVVWTARQLAANLAALVPGGTPPADGIPPIAAAVVPPPVTTAPPVTTSPPPPSTVPLTEFSALQARLGELEKERADREANARQIEFDALKVKGDYEKLFTLHQQQSQSELATERARLKDVEERSKRYALDRELALALASKPLVPAALST